MLAIFLIETKNKMCDSDYMYIRAVLNQWYDYGHDKLVSIYLDGKGNYNKKEKQIKQYIKAYRAAGNETEPAVVFMCVDLDCVTGQNHSQENIQLNNKIQSYCTQHKYEFVWFYETIEGVFCGQHISDSEKVETAKRFFKNEQIAKIKQKTISLVKFDETKKNTSNIKYVLGKYFSSKQIQ